MFTVLIVATPAIVSNGLVQIPASREVIEMLLLLFFSTSALTIHYLRERKLHKFLKQCKSCKRQLRDLSKDLSSSYTYIGEINRKIDILMELASRLPNDSILQTKEIQDIEHSIFKAIESFSDSKYFCVGLYDYLERKSVTILQSDENEIFRCPPVSFFENEELLSTHEDDLYFIKTTRTDSAHLVAFSVIRKSSIRSINIELIKTALQKFLFLRTYRNQRLHAINTALALE